MSIRVIGIGTPHGDDAAGLHVAERLTRAGLPDGVRVMVCQRGVDLLDALGDARVAVIVDAMRSGAPPGAVQQIPQEALRAGSGVSTHAFSVADALSLARALGRAPVQVELIGIEAGSASYAELSPAVEAGIVAASALVRTLLERIAGASVRG